MVYLSVMGRKILLVVLFYFLSGVPLGFFYSFIPVQLRSQGVELSTIGLVSLAGLAWSLKPLWAPFIDGYLSRGLWMGIFLLALSLTFLGISLSNPTAEYFFVLLLFLTLSSSLYDTSLDGWFIEHIPREWHGRGNGYRLSAYRVALIASGGLAIALSQVVHHRLISLSFGLLYLSVGLPALFRFKREHRSFPQDATTILSRFAGPFRDLLVRRSALLILSFVFVYKLGDALLGGMVYPFWVDRGFSKAEIGLIASTLGTVLTIVGSLVGGYTTARIGLRRALLYFGLLQALSNLFYAFSALPEVRREAVYLASVVESFTGGLGTSAFLTFLTGLCRKEMASSQYAILSMLFSLSMSLGRGVSGILASTMGYAVFFSLSFLVAILPLILIRSLPLEEAEKA